MNEFKGETKREVSEIDNQINLRTDQYAKKLTQVMIERIVFHDEISPFSL